MRKIERKKYMLKSFCLIILHLFLSTFCLTLLFFLVYRSSGSVFYDYPYQSPTQYPPQVSNVFLTESTVRTIDLMVTPQYMSNLKVLC